MKYLLSFEGQIMRDYTVKPRWWQFWKGPKIESEAIWTRMCFPITSAEYQAFCTQKGEAQLLAEILKRATCSTPLIRNLMIEQVEFNNGYITNEIN